MQGKTKGSMNTFALRAHMLAIRCANNPHDTKYEFHSSLALYRPCIRCGAHIIIM